MTRFLFATDLDNTLVGDDRALEELYLRLDRSASAHGTKVVYITGRSPTLYRQLATERRLLQPDALVTAVGTEIYYESVDNAPDAAWAETLLQGWDRQQVVATAATFPDLVPQPNTEQRPFKASYFLTAEAAMKVLPRLNTQLQERGLSTQTLYSGNKNLDVLPKRGDKGSAMRFLRHKWGFDPTHTVACGDSGNDIAMFSMGRERGIIVGNAEAELLQWYERNPADHLYLAKAHYAAGIVEGLRHFGFLDKGECC